MDAVPEHHAAFEIDAEKPWRIWLLFGLLATLVFATLWVVLVVAGVLFALLLAGAGGDSALSGTAWLFILQSSLVLLAVAVPVSVVYWFVSRIGARRRLFRAMHCRPLDPGDRYHQRLADIVDEMRIATGAPRIECFTVATLGRAGGPPAPRRTRDRLAASLRSFVRRRDDTVPALG